MFGWGSWGILSWKAAAAFAYLSVLTVVAVIDWNTRIIYDRFHIMILSGFLLGISGARVMGSHDRSSDCIISYACFGIMYWGGFWGRGY